MTFSDTAVDRDLLAVVLDRLIPAETGFPSAGAVAVEHVLRQIPKQPAVVPLLAAIEQAGRNSGAASFAALPESEQMGVLQRLEADQAEAFEALLVQTYSGYYTHPSVLELLGLDPTPPQPRGHVLEPFDVRILDRVRQRGPIYRAP